MKKTESDFVGMRNTDPYVHTVTQKESLQLLSRLLEDTIASTTYGLAKEQLKHALENVSKTMELLEGEDLYDSIVLRGEKGRKITVRL